MRDLPARLRPRAIAVTAAVAVAGVIGWLVVGHSAGAPSRPAAATSPAPTRTAAGPLVGPVAVAAAAGPLYPPSEYGSQQTHGLTHYCSASVVHSGGHDVIVTAAHCVHGTGVGTEFVPGYRDDRAPYGTWKVTAAYVDPAWEKRHDPHDDVAFLRVAKHAGRGVEDVAGAHLLGTAPADGAQVTVTAYTSGSDDEPLRCRSSVYYTQGYPTIDCAGYAGGTSGGPWIDDSGDLVGVIGGYQLGGCAVDTSYSIAFSASTAELLKRAEDGEETGDPGDLVLPAVGNDCP